MAHPQRRSNPLLAALLLISTGAAWLLFAPTAVGGQASYVVINGNSMEPGMRRGDLAILRQSANYAVGEVVTYKHPEIGPVIHRIIGREGPHYIFKGDNNNFIDPHRPAAHELIGRLWIFVPKAGALLIFLRQPPIFAGLAALMIGAATMATGSVPRPRHWPDQPARVQGPERAALLNGVLTFALALGLSALGLAAVAFGQPTTRTVELTQPYTQRASFDYGAPAPAELFDGGRVHGGEPVFRRLNNTVAVTTTYTFDADVPVELAGTARLQLLVGDGAGWQRTLDLGPVVAFRGPSVTLSGTIDLPTVQATLRSYEAQTGLRQAAYQLSVAPTFETQGVMGGEQFTTSYSPRLTFSLDELRLRPLLDSPDQALTSEESATLTTTKARQSSIALWVLRLDVLTARRLALAGLEIALVVGALAAWLLSRELKRNPLTAAQLRTGVQVLKAGSGGPWTHGAVSLSTAADLAQLAAQHRQPIIQIEHGPEAGFYVRVGDQAYVYTERSSGEA